MKKLLLIFMMVFLVSTVYAYSCYDADIDGNGRVDRNDLNILNHFYNDDCSSFNSHCEGADINKDGRVDIDDWNILSDFYGEGCSIHRIDDCDDYHRHYYDRNDYNYLDYPQSEQNTKTSTTKIYVIKSEVSSVSGSDYSWMIWILAGMIIVLLIVILSLVLR
jgi:hypothetical protein